MSIEFLHFGDIIVCINTNNGNFFYLNEDEFNDEESLKIRTSSEVFNAKVEQNSNFNKEQLTTIFIGLHTSTSCNLNCGYCFNKDRTNKNMTFDQAKKFIDLVISEYHQSYKFIIDLTGSGEPLLNIDFIEKVSIYCKKKMNEIGKNIGVLLATNGTLLTPENVKRLQDLNVLFSVSLDGNKKANDFFRKYKNGKGTYKDIIYNVKKIKNKDNLGVSTTVTNINHDLVKNMKIFEKYFSSIAFLHVRALESDGGYSNNNIEIIKNEYSKLYEFLIEKTVARDFRYIKLLLRGGDYFGRFITRVMLGLKVSTRCDAGIGRFSLDIDGKIYTCAPAMKHKDLCIGNLDDGLFDDKIEKIWNILSIRKGCQDCFAKFICGGECLVVSEETSGTLDSINEISCDLRKHLIKLALLFSGVLRKNHINIYDNLYYYCIDLVKNLEVDFELQWVHKTLKNKYSFTELNEMKFFDFKKYDNIKKSLLEAKNLNEPINYRTML